MILNSIILGKRIDQLKRKRNKLMILFMLLAIIKGNKKKNKRQCTNKNISKREKAIKLFFYLKI